MRRLGRAGAEKYKSLGRLKRFFPEMTWTLRGPGFAGVDAETDGQFVRLEIQPVEVPTPGWMVFYEDRMLAWGAHPLKAVLLAFPKIHEEIRATALQMERRARKMRYLGGSLSRSCVPVRKMYIRIPGLLE